MIVPKNATLRSMLAAGSLLGLCALLAVVLLTATEQLTLLVTAQLELTTWSRPEMARLFLQPVELPEPYRGRTRRVREQHDEIFRTVVRRGIAAGEFGGAHVGDGVIALHNLYGAINHVPIWFRGRRRQDFDRMAEAVAGNVLRLFRPSE